MNRSRLPPWAFRAVQLAVACGLLALLWHVADGAAAARLLAGANPLWLMAAMAVLTLQTGLSALRWRLTAAQLGISLGLGVAVREYYLSQIVNQALPGGVIGDAGRVVRSRQAAGLMAAGQAVVFERLAGQIALFAFMTLGFLASLILPGGLDWPLWAGGSVAALIAAGLIVPGLLWALAHLGRAAGLRRQGAALRIALLAPQVRARQIALSLATVMCNIAGFGFCIWAVGVALPIRRHPGIGAADPSGHGDPAEHQRLGCARGRCGRAVPAGRCWCQRGAGCKHRVWVGLSGQRSARLTLAGPWNQVAADEVLITRPWRLRETAATDGVSPLQSAPSGLALHALQERTMTNRLTMTRRGMLRAGAAGVATASLGLASGGLMARRAMAQTTPAALQLSWLHSVQFAGSYIAQERGWWTEGGSGCVAVARRAECAGRAAGGGGHGAGGDFGGRLYRGGG